MTVRELIQALQDLGEKDLDKQIMQYDEYRYVCIEGLKPITDTYYDTHTGNWVTEEMIGLI